MPNIGTMIARGVGAGLSTYGQLEQARQDKQAAREERAEDSARKDKELALREKEVGVRVKAQEFQNNLAQAKQNHAQYTSMVTGSNYDPEIVAKAASLYIKNGMTYTYNPVETAANNGIPVFDMATVDTDEKGEIIPGDDGKPKLIQAPGPFKQLKFKSWDDYVNRFTKEMNADYAIAMQMAGIDEHKARTQMDIAHQALLKAEETEGGQAKIKLTQAKTREAEANAARLEREAEGKGQSKIQQMGLKEFAKDLRGRFVDSTISMKTAKLIADRVDNEDTPPKIATLISKALDPKDPVTRVQVLRDGVKKGYPKEYLESLFRDAEALAEEEGAALGSDGWFKQFGSALKNYFD
jgi:hypothetical protein